MKVEDIMMRTAAYCTPDTNLGAAVELLWNRNCGMLPVVSAEGRVVGVVTDRDMCIALGTRNRSAGEISVGEVFSGKLFSCRPEEDVRAALGTMSREKVRRLPVVDRDGLLAGILSMDDVVRHVEFGASGRGAELSLDDVLRTLRNIYTPQLPELVKPRSAAA